MIRPIPLIVRFRSFSHVPHGISTRAGGVSPPPYESLNVGYGVPDREENVAANRALLAGALGVDTGRVVAGSITHGRDISVLRKDAPEEWPLVRVPVRPGSDRPLRCFPSDGVVSDVPGLSFLLTFADCVPLLFSDGVGRVVGIAHAGWRGMALGMGPAVVGVMQREFGVPADEVRVGIGPSIGACCYTVGDDVPQAFARNGYQAIMTEHGTLDLWGSARLMLEKAGVRPSHIECLDLCTSCHTDIFFSHRAEGGRTGRFALVAGVGI